MEIALIALSIFAASFMISYISVARKLKTVSDGFAELFVAYTSMRDAVEAKQAFSSSPEDQDVHRENFIKFLSDSRDWAFDYIEQSQEVIKDIIVELNNIDRKDLSDKLVKLLPETNDDRR